jgi:PKHD-type hydroxylase
MFVRITRVLTDEQVATLTQSLSSEAAPWVDGKATAGYQGAQVKNNRQLDEASPMARDLGNMIVGELERNSLFVSALLPNRVYPPMFNKYTPGMAFGTHVDGTIRGVPGSPFKIRTDLSATLFLTPPAAYDGGELVVESDFGNQAGKFEAGELLVYSATSRHRIAPITRGERLACVFWIQSLVRDDDKREKLFELDRTIQTLTQAKADPDSLVRLTAHYHALLRMWTDV